MKQSKADHRSSYRFIILCGLLDLLLTCHLEKKRDFEFCKLLLLAFMLISGENILELILDVSDGGWGMLDEHGLWATF